MKRIAVTAFFAAVLAAACAVAAGSPPIRIFHHIGIRPAHPSAPPDAIAKQFCLDKGYTEAGAHLFIGFAEMGGTITAHFRQIACRTYELREVEQPKKRVKVVAFGG